MSRTSASSALLRFAAIAVLALVAGACGSKIGDSCTLDTDCDPQGTRTCDTSYPGGYCTIIGCDYNTCPDNAVCVAFFTGDYDNLPCNFMTEDKGGSDGTNDCSIDEVCTLNNFCAAAASQINYCMAACSSDGDCRGGYECRNLTLMEEHGGEPVLAPGTPINSSAPNFCAAAPAPTGT